MSNREHVLIIGGGITGLETARELIRADHAVTLVEQSPQLGGVALFLREYRKRVEELIATVSGFEGIVIHTATSINRIRGQIGRFEVTFNAKELTTTYVTQIVVAIGADVVFPSGLYPSRLPGMLDLLEAHRSDFGIRNAINQSKRVVLIAGYGKHSKAFTMRRILNVALDLRKSSGCDVTIIMDMIRFDGAWIPIEYEECRRLGILFIRSRVHPEVRKADERLTIHIEHESLMPDASGTPITITADHVILEPDFQPRLLKSVFWSLHEPRQNSDGFYGGVNNHYDSIQTNRKGIFVLGSATGMKSVAQCRDDVHLFMRQMARSETRPSVPRVDEDRCAACLTCARVCPHAAISVTHASTIDDAACTVCGICAAECPAEAITMPTEPAWRNPCAEWAGDCVVFCCTGSGRDAMQNSIERSGLPPGFRVFEIECGGGMRMRDILDLLLAGISRIVFFICQDGNCKHVHGNTRLVKRLVHTQKLLLKLGVASDRLLVVRTASQDAPALRPTPIVNA